MYNDQIFLSKITKANYKEAIRFPGAAFIEWQAVCEG